LNKKENNMEIKDSGERRHFNTGAVRDLSEGKGRFDLMPIDTMAKLFEDNNFIQAIKEFTITSDPFDLQVALNVFIQDNYRSYDYAMLELAKHFEEGCKKYGDRNWQLGVPIHCYVDSTLRHYFKYKDNWNDEPHNNAVMWNIICCIWTCEHKPELLEEYKEEIK